MWRVFALSALAAAIAGGAVVVAPKQPLPMHGRTRAAMIGSPHFWPGYQYHPSHNAVFEGSQLRANWLVRLGDKINGGLAVVDGTVYAVSFDKSLYAIEEATGKLRWSSRTD